MTGPRELSNMLTTTLVGIVRQRAVNGSPAMLTFQLDGNPVRMEASQIEGETGEKTIMLKRADANTVPPIMLVIKDGATSDMVAIKTESGEIELRMQSDISIEAAVTYVKTTSGYQAATDDTTDGVARVTWDGPEATILFTDPAITSELLQACGFIEAGAETLRFTDEPLAASEVLVDGAVFARMGYAILKSESFEGPQSIMRNDIRLGDYQAMVNGATGEFGLNRTDGGGAPLGHFRATWIDEAKGLLTVSSILDGGMVQSVTTFEAVEADDGAMQIRQIDVSTTRDLGVITMTAKGEATAAGLTMVRGTAASLDVPVSGSNAATGTGGSV